MASTLLNRRAASVLLHSSSKGTTVSATRPGQVIAVRTLFSRPAPPSFLQRTRGVIGTTLLLTGGALFLLYVSDTRAGIHRWLVIPTLHALTASDPELGHRFAIKALELPLRPKDHAPDDEILSFELWGKKFSNPIGLAAGFDKHAEAVDGLFDLGFGYVEVGSVTPEAQPGNPPPRLFRLPSSQAVINRYGFNSEGHAPVISRLRARIRRFIHHNALSLPTTLFPDANPSAVVEADPVTRLLSSDLGRDAQLTDSLDMPRSLVPGKVLGINLGKNKHSDPDSVEDFVRGVERLGPYADVLVINVSSPNTPGLRSLQRRGMFEELLGAVVKARNELDGKVKPPVLVKIAPDLDQRELEDIASAALGTRIDGIIVSNTTITRPETAGKEPSVNEVGGLSGPPLKPLALNALSYLYKTTFGRIPLVGCGGIVSGEDALDYAKAGASFVQLYTGLGYEGVGLPRKIKDEVTDRLRSEGKTWKDVVGSSTGLQSDAGFAPSKVPLSESREKGETEVLKPEEKEGDFASTLATLKRELQDVIGQIAEAESGQGRESDSDGKGASGASQAARKPSPSPEEAQINPPSTSASSSSPSSSKKDTPISPAAVIQGVVPVAVDAQPTSGYLEPSLGGASSNPAGQDSTKSETPSGQGEGTPASSQPEGGKEADSRKEGGEGTKGGLSSLGSSFGMRASAGKDGKRLV